jgi:hypothetical protein
VNPGFSDESITLTATITPTSATGSVTFMDGSTTRGVGTVSGGVATLLVPPKWTPGDHSLTANYGGDSNNPSAVSNTVTETVDAEIGSGPFYGTALTGNLLTNPGAENGMAGWWPEFPVSSSVPATQPPGTTGSYSFFGGQAPNAFISQTVKLANVSGISLPRLDNGLYVANYSFSFADLNPGSGLRGQITLTYFDATGTVRLGQGVSPELSDPGTFNWSQQSGSFSIPSGTRIIVFTMDFHIGAGGVDHGLMDNLVLEIANIPPPA